jgi:hypothetical protein
MSAVARPSSRMPDSSARSAERITVTHPGDQAAPLAQQELRVATAPRRRGARGAGCDSRDQEAAYRRTPCGPGARRHWYEAACIARSPTGVVCATITRCRMSFQLNTVWLLMDAPHSATAVNPTHSGACLCGKFALQLGEKCTIEDKRIHCRSYCGPDRRPNSRGVLVPELAADEVTVALNHAPTDSTKGGAVVNPCVGLAPR